MSNGPKTRPGRVPPGDLPAAAVIRAQAKDDPAVSTFLVTREANAPELVADMSLPDSPFSTVEVLDRDALPLITHSAPFALAKRPPRTVLTVGTTVGDEWETWHADPVEREPVPGSPAWHARRDQMTAAAGAAMGYLAAGQASGARLRQGDEDSQPRAIREMTRRFRDGVLTGTRCPHKSPGRAEVTHQFGHQPDRRLCERCARLLLPYAPGACNLCGTHNPEGGLTVATAVHGHLLQHMALCDDCYPEGADAPRTGPEAAR